MDIKKIEIMGKAIKAGDEMVSLTDLWRASGLGTDKNPKEWMRQAENVEFMAACVSKVGGNPTLSQRPEAKRGSTKQIRGWAAGVRLECEKAGALKSVMGRNGGTFAHWQIALAYAKWLSPELHLQVNDIYRRFQEADPALAESVIDRTESVEDLKRIESRARNKQTNKALNGVIASHGGDYKTHARVADVNNIAVTGKTAKQIREDKGLPKKASTRPHLPTNSMIHMAFLEDLETKSIEKKRPLGHSAIVANVCDVANSLQSFIAQYA